MPGRVPRALPPGECWALQGLYDQLFVPEAPQGAFSRIHQALASDPAVLSSHFLSITEVCRAWPGQAIEPPAVFFAVAPRWGAPDVVEVLAGLDAVRCLYRVDGAYGVCGVASGEAGAFQAQIAPQIAERTRHLLLEPLVEPTGGGLSLAPDPEAIEGPHLRRLSHPKERCLAAGILDHFTPELIQDFGAGLIALARRWVAVEAEHGPIELLYGPARGALPLVDGLLEAYRRLCPGRRIWEPALVLPPTSSFLRGVHGTGHQGHALELERLWRRGVLPCRVGYLDEIISGGMFRKHVKEFVAIGERHERPLEVHGFALADQGGRRFRGGVRYQRQALEQGWLRSLDWIGVREFVTEDRRQLLGVHYTDYALGLHLVPFTDVGGGACAERRSLHEGLLRCLDEASLG